MRIFRFKRNFEKTITFAVFPFICDCGCGEVHWLEEHVKVFRRGSLINWTDRYTIEHFDKTIRKD